MGSRINTGTRSKEARHLEVGDQLITTTALVGNKFEVQLWTVTSVLRPICSGRVMVATFLAQPGFGDTYATFRDRSQDEDKEHYLEQCFEFKETREVVITDVRSRYDD